MKSLHVAVTAIAVSGTTLAAVAMVGNTDQILGRSYERALMAATAPSSPALVAAAHAPGSEHFWLTRKTEDGDRITPTLTTGPAVAMADIRQAIATAGSYDAARLEIINVQDIARASLAGPAPAGRSILVTAKLPPTERQPARIVRFVLDVGTAGAPARAL